MSPEFGSTCAIFPVDAETLRYLEFTGRPTETIELVDAYAREQGMFHDARLRGARPSPTCSSSTSATSSPASPGRSGPQDRVPLADAKEAFLEAMEEFDPEAGEQLGNGRDEAIEESFPASDPPAEDHDDERRQAAPGDRRHRRRRGASAQTSDAIAVDARGRHRRSSSTTAGS